MKHHLFQRLLDPGIIAIIRADSPDRLIPLAGALHEGGVMAMEITMTTPGALEAIAAIAGRFRAIPQDERPLIGAGSVLDPETARAALLAGATFLVTPTTSIPTIRLANRYGKPIISGAYTPTEALHAFEHGADAVKIFPAENLGPSYIRNLLAPMPHLPLIPTGGVTVENLATWMKAGSVAVGVGSALVGKALPDSREGDEGEEGAEWAGIRARAAAFVAAMKAARAAL